MNTGSQENSYYGEHLPMNAMQEMSHGNPTGIAINEPDVSSRGASPFTRPLLSNGALVEGQNWPVHFGSTPTNRCTGDTAQMSGMSFCSSYYDQSQTSAPPSRDIERPMGIPSFNQTQPLFRMPSSDPVKLSPHTSSFDGFEHTMGSSCSYPNQSTVFTQNPYHSHLQPSDGTPSSVQGGHSSRSTCMYESAPTVGFSRGAHNDSGAPTMSDLCTASLDQVQPSFITSDFDGYEDTMGISSSNPAIDQSSYHVHVQPSVGIPSRVQVAHSSRASCIYKSAPSIGDISCGHQEVSRRSVDTNTNSITFHESSAVFCESSMIPHRLQSDHYGYPTVETTLVTRAPSQSFKPSCQSNELNAPDSVSDINIYGTGITQLKDPMNQETKKFECQVCQKKFRYQSVLRHHLAVHTDEKPFECNKCGRKYRHHCNLKFHYKSVHHDDGDHIFQCERCDQKFGYAASLKRHYDRGHCGMKNFVCIKCGQKFNHDHCLKTHYDRVHVDADLFFKCESCGRKFLFKDNLKRHYDNVHLGRKPFECIRCDQKYDRKDSLEAHYNRVHLDVKLFECETCARSYYSKNGLKQHSCKMKPLKGAMDVIENTVVACTCWSKPKH